MQSAAGHTGSRASMTFVMETHPPPKKRIFEDKVLNGVGLQDNMLNVGVWLGLKKSTKKFNLGVQNP